MPRKIWFCFLVPVGRLLKIRQFLSVDNAKMLVHALVVNRIDFSNIVLYRIATVHLHPLQSVLNALQLALSSNCASSIVFRSQGQFATSCTGQRSTNGLSVLCKLCLMVYKCQHYLAPSYLSSLWVPLVATCWLQPRAFWIFHVQELLHLVLVLLQFLDLRARTLYPYS